MKTNFSSFQLLVFAIFIYTISSCGESDTTNVPTSEPEPIENVVVEPKMTIDGDGMVSEVQHPAVDIEPMADFIEPMADAMPLPSEESTVASRDYKVVLAADSTIHLGQSGILEVWIGQEDVEVEFVDGMTQDQSTMPGNLGKFAKIIPYAPDFTVEAISTIVCYKIDPSGSQVRFSLVPKERGTYEVSVAIELYENETCTGIVVPKAAKALKVFVDVDRDKKVHQKMDAMEDVVWSKLMIFWTSLITLLFGAAIFIIRRYIKSKSGYEDNSPA